MELTKIFVDDEVEAQVSPLPIRILPRGCTEEHTSSSEPVFHVPTEDSDDASTWFFFEDFGKAGHLPQGSEQTGPRGAHNKGCFCPGSGRGFVSWLLVGS